MQLEKVVTELPPADRMRSVDMLAFKHKVYEDVKTGHLYIQLEGPSKFGLRVMRLTNED